MSYDPHHGPYEAHGPYRGDHLRRWIVAATEWKAEAVRLSAENRELRERLDAARANQADVWRLLWRQPNT